MDGTEYQPDDDEAQLLNQIREKGEEEFANFFMANRVRLRRMISIRLDQRLTQRVDASDVLQEGFVDAVKRLNEYLDKPSAPLIVWLRFLLGQKLRRSIVGISTPRKGILEKNLPRKLSYLEWIRRSSPGSFRPA